MNRIFIHCSNIINRYLCPFCNNAASEPTSLALHFEEHFCCCPNCELYFTSIEVLNLHCQDCIADEKVMNVVKNSTEPQGQQKRRTTTEKKQPGSSRPKWTPKICTHCGKQYRTNYKLQVCINK